MRQRLELALRHEPSVDGLRAAVESSIADTDAILRTFSALLRVARIKSGTRRAEFIGGVLDNVIEAYLPVVEERGQHLTGAITPGLQVHGDRELLTQAIAKVVENAINHAPPGSSLDVAGEITVDSVCVSASDDGPGIPQAERAKVRQRFYRLESSRNRPGQG